MWADDELDLFEFVTMMADKAAREITTCPTKRSETKNPTVVDNTQESHD